MKKIIIYSSAILLAAALLLLGGYYWGHRARPGPVDTTVTVDSTITATGHLPSDDPGATSAKGKIATAEHGNSGGGMNSRTASGLQPGSYSVPLTGSEQANWTAGNQTGTTVRDVTGTGALTVNPDLSMDLEVSLEGDPFSIEVEAQPKLPKWKIGVGASANVDQQLAPEWFAYAKVVKPIFIGDKIEVDPSLAIGYGSGGVEIELGAEWYFNIY